jgi:hypothetical protein
MPVFLCPPTLIYGANTGPRPNVFDGRYAMFNPVSGQRDDVLATWEHFLKWSYGDRWEEFAGTAPTPSELEAFEKILFHDDFLEKCLNKVDKTQFAKAIEKYLGVVERDPFATELEFIEAHWPKESLLDLLRAKFERRIRAERGARLRTKLCRPAGMPRAETGSASALAKRMNPLGAPPLNA